MFDIKSVSLDWAGRKLTLETGRIARQADAAVLATYGETIHTFIERDGYKGAFRPTYDGSKTEPTVLPSKIPHLLMNGTTGPPMMAITAR